MPPAPHASRRPLGTRLARLVIVVLVALGCVAGGRSIDAAEESAAKAHSAFESAWTASSSKRVGALMDPKGTLRVKVLKPRNAGGTWTLDQAKKGLAAYFGEKGISKPKLKDVTPRTNRKKTVRVYDYTYRPHGGDEQKTRLTVTVKQDADKKWVLGSVIESPRPRR